MAQPQTFPFADDIVSSLPQTLPSGGLFTPTNNVPDTGPVGADLFHSTASNASIATYSEYILSPSHIIGSVLSPYMPVALPAYISTLYQNVYNINANLVSDMNTAAQNDRTYPTVNAVQQYVTDQLSGTQYIGTSTGTTPPQVSVGTVDTTHANTVIYDEVGPALYGDYLDVPVPGGSTVQTNIFVFVMEETPNIVKVGSTKQVIFNCASLFSNTDTKNPLLFLYAGKNSYFMVNGVQQKLYQATHVGDNISFVLLANPQGTGWQFMVTGFQSLFANQISASGKVTPAPPPTVATPYSTSIASIVVQNT